MRRPAGLLPAVLAAALLGLVAVLLTASGAAAADGNEAKVVFTNQGSVDVDVFWRHPETKEYMLLSTIAQGAGQDISTFRGHEFLVKPAGSATPAKTAEPNYVQQEAAEHKFVLKTKTEGVGGRNRVDVDIIPELSGLGSGSAGNGTAAAASGKEPGPEGQEEAPRADNAASVTIKNNAGSTLGIYWLEVSSGESYMKLAVVDDAQSTTINTFLGHRLLIAPVDDERLSNFGPVSFPPNIDVKGDQVVRVEEDEEDEDEVKVITESLVVAKSSSGGAAAASKPARRAQQQQQQQKKGAATTTTTTTAKTKAVPAVPGVPASKPVTLEMVKQAIARCGKGSPACIADALYRPRVAAIQKSAQVEMTERDEVEEAYRDFACLNYDTTLPDKFTTGTWVYEPPAEDCDAAADAEAAEACSAVAAEARREVRVDHFFEAPAGNARVYLLHDFVSPRECQAIKERAGPRLAAAAVTGENPGEKIVSKSRKAKAALVRPDVTPGSGDPLGALQQRIFAFVNEYGGGGYENFTLPGQEPFNAIMYNTTGDEYRVHCDGYCDSSPFKPGGRAATVVVFCEEAARGGQTSFTNADLLVKGKAGQAVFFHYRGPEGLMDSGWTKHGGCPVVEGTKWIATQWIRDGVSAEDPWYHFTPVGDRDGPRNFVSSDPNY